jgi:lambda repressor-like predicted transcriptional regulator
MVRLDPEAVEAEMRRRGWNRKDLSRESRVSMPTIRAALRGSAIRGAKARAIRLAFRRCPPDLDGLTAVPGAAQ